MKISKKELLNQLEKVKPGLASQEIIEQSDCFVFKNKHILTYNDEIAVSTTTDLDIEAAVKSRELLQLLSKLKTDEIDITQTNSELLIKETKKKGTKSGITLQETIELPTDFLSIKLKFKKLPDNFMEGLKVCLFSTASEKESPLFSNVHVIKNKMESTDVARATFFNIDSEMEEVLIPNNAIRHIKNYNFTDYCIKDGWIHFKKKNVIFSCRTQKDSFPDLSSYFEVKGIPISLPDELQDGLQQANIFANDQASSDSMIEINIEDNNMFLTSKNDNGWIEVPIALKKKIKKNLHFNVSASLLLDILSKTKKAIISDKLMRFKTKSFSHIIVLQHKEK